MRGEVYEGPDRFGNYHYAIFWLANYHPGHPDGEYGWRERGQHYYGNPERHNIDIWEDFRILNRKEN